MRTDARCPLCGKRSFASVRAARRACQTLSNRIRVYRCPACHDYHVTSQTHPDAGWR